MALNDSGSWVTVILSDQGTSLHLNMTAREHRMGALSKTFAGSVIMDDIRAGATEVLLEQESSHLKVMIRE